MSLRGRSTQPSLGSSAWAPWLISVALVLALLIRATAATGLSLPQDIGALNVESYQKDFGVSAQVAERNLRLQQQGVGIVEELKQSTGDRYAGVWFDNQAGEFVVPILPDANRAYLASVLSAGQLEGNYRTPEVASSWSELEESQADIGKMTARWSQKGLLQTSLDPRTNAVVIRTAAEITKADQDDLEALAASQPVKVEIQHAEVDRFKVGLRACQTSKPRHCGKPLRGGTEIGPMTPLGGGGFNYQSGICTAGFKAIGNTFGNRFILTAGHCPWLFGNRWGSASYPSEAIWEIGTVEEYNFSSTGDWAKIKANGSEWDKGVWPAEVTHYWENQDYPINYEAWSYVGEYVCFSGNKSGTSCANVSRIHVEGLHDDLTGAAFPPETELTGVCNEGGDSGGPFFLYGANTALGMLSAGAEGVGCNDLAYYVEITEATSAMGLSVGTRIGGAPVAATETASNIQPRQATANGSVNPNGVETEYHFEYGLTTSYGTSVPDPNGNAGHGGSPMGASATMTGLLPAATYHFRLVAKSPAGTSYGSDASFTSLPVPPVVVTEGASSIKAGKATIGGSVNPEGASTQYRFEYGPTASYGTSIPVPDATIGVGRTGVTVSQIIGVKGLMTYHYRLVASNVAGTTYGVDREFKTPDWRPGVMAEEVSAITVTSATIGAAVDPKGLSTKYHLEYGTTPSYGTSLPSPEQEVGSGEGAIKVSHVLSGLKVATLYHLRLVATNSDGTTEVKSVFETLTPSTLCKVSGPACIPAQRYPSGTSIQGKLKSGKFKLESGLFTQECTESVLSGKSAAETSAPLPVEVTGLTAGGCSPCKVVEVLNLPYSGSVGSPASGEGSKGSFVIKGGAKGNPAVKLSSCTFGATCVFAAPEVGYTLEGGSPATLSASGTKLSLVEGQYFLCGEWAKLAGAYELTNPKPLYPGDTSETVPCKSFASPCAKADTYPEGVKMTAKLQGPLNVYLGNFGAQSCTGGTFNAATKSDAGNPLVVQTESMTLSGCTPCSNVTVPGLPLNGSIRATSKGNAQLLTQITIKWTGCPFGALCKYGTGGMPVEIRGGSPATLALSKAILKLEEGSESICGSQMEVSGLFSVTAPSGFWVAKGRS